MTPLRTSVGTFAHHRRRIAAASLLSVAALAVTGCGSEVSGSGTRGAPGRGADSQVRSVQPSPEQMAFAAMLDEFAQECPSVGTTGRGPTRERPPVLAEMPSAEMPSAETRSPAPGETPPTDPIEPGAFTGPGAELSDRDWCAGGRHEQRIIEALQTVAEPTPAKVRTTLNRLGYIDEHIHGLRQDGRTTRFYLDLRESGGRLCEAGVAAGIETDVTKCSAPATGRFVATEADENA